MTIQKPFRSCVLCIAILVLLCTAISTPAQIATVASPNRSTSKRKTNHAERCVAAVDLAVLAAESGIMDVSMEAMHRACKKGPPVASIELSGILSPGARQPRNRQNQHQEQENAQVELAKRLQRLQAAWIKYEADPQQAYDAWKGLIFPPSRPNEAFSYSTEVFSDRIMRYGSTSLDVEEPDLIKNGAAILIDWARQAEQLDDLRSLLEERKSHPGSANVAMLVRVMLASHESTPTVEAEILCKELAERPGVLVSGPDSELMLGWTWQMMKRLGKDSEASGHLLNALFAATSSVQRWPANTWLRFLVYKAIRDSISAGDPERFHDAVDLALSEYDSIRSNNEDYFASRKVALYSEAATRAFEAGQSKLGTECLKIVSLTPLGSRYSNSSRTMTDFNSPLMNGLFQMMRSERMSLLDAIVWKAPKLGIERNSRLIPTEDSPSVFSAAMVKSNKEEAYSRLAAPGAMSYSALGWVMIDSLAAGKEAEIEKRIAELEARQSDDAALARLVWNMIRNKPIDLQLLSEEDENGQIKYKLPYGNKSRVGAFDLELIRILEAEGSDQASLLAFINQRLARAKRQVSFLCIPWLRYFGWKHRSEENGKPTSDLLSHWQKTSDYTSKDLLQGMVPHVIWTQRGEDVWGHQCSPGFSYLVLRYPLEGDFTVEFEGLDGGWQEPFMSLGGMLIEFANHLSKVNISGIGERATEGFETEVMKRGKWNSYRLVCKDKKMTLTVGDDEYSVTAGVYSEHFPFLALASQPYRSTSIKGLKVTGDCAIDREVEMLSPTLIGWTAQFKQGVLPELMMDEEDCRLTVIQEETNEHWRFTNGEIHSVDLETEQNANEKTSDSEPFVEERREALVQYLRPLAQDEQVALEFYHESGKYSLAPCIGRIALLLDQPEVGLHWVTCDDKHWSGLGHDNRVVDPQAEQLASLQLKEKDWNKLVFRFEGENLIMSINGQDVYRRKWESGFDRKFGLFHDPKSYHVKARKLILSGEWPKSLPNDLFQLRDSINLKEVRSPVHRIPSQNQFVHQR